MFRSNISAKWSTKNNSFYRKNNYLLVKILIVLNTYNSDKEYDINYIEELVHLVPSIVKNVMF